MQRSRWTRSCRDHLLARLVGLENGPGTCQHLGGRGGDGDDVAPAPSGQVPGGVARGVEPPGGRDDVGDGLGLDFDRAPVIVETVLVQKDVCELFSAPAGGTGSTVVGSGGIAAQLGGSSSSPARISAAQRWTVRAVARTTSESAPDQLATYPSE